MSERPPVYDNHVHMSPSGRNVDALLEYEAAGGTGLTLVTLPYAEVPIRDGPDFAESYRITYDLAQRARERTSLEINIAVGPYPVLIIPLAEAYGLERAEEIMIRGMEDAARDVAEGRAVAFGELGRPHFPVSEEIWDASNRVLLRGMELAREAGCPVIIHCESEPYTDRSLAELADRAGLDRGMVVKHSSPPLVTPEETHGVMPSMPASKTNVREAMAKGTDRFMIETDYIDDPAKPGAIMSVTTVPKKVKAWLANGEVPVESIHRICGDIPDSLYRRRRMARILCVYDEGSVVDTPLIGAKGTAFIVESEGRRILFDTGLRDRYLEHNLEHLEIDPESIEAVVVSQGHPDNCRGINGFLDMRQTPVDVVAPAGLYDGKRGLLSSSVGLSDENRAKANLRTAAGWEEIIPGVWLSPALGTDGYAESFLVIKGEHVAILSGRAHQGPGEILAAAKERFGMEPRLFIGSILLEKKKKPVAEAYAAELDAHGCTGLHLNHCTGRDGMTNLRVHFGLKGVDEFYAGMSLDLRSRRHGRKYLS